MPVVVQLLLAVLVMVVDHAGCATAGARAAPPTHTHHQVLGARLLLVWLLPLLWLLHG